MTVRKTYDKGYAEGFVANPRQHQRVERLASLVSYSRDDVILEYVA